MAEIKDPENTILDELRAGLSPFKLLPELPPSHVRGV